MKRAVSLLVVLVVLAVLVWAARSRTTGSKNSSIAVVPKVLPLNKTVPPFAKPPPLMASSEWQTYHSAREAVLASNPALEAEYKQILQEMDGQQAKLDAAMVKADPKSGPMIAKLEALRARNGVPATSPSSSNSAEAPHMTAEDWQEIRTARSEAVKANPNLTMVSKALVYKMRAFESSLDSAMIKQNPGVAPVISKFEGRSSAVVVNSPTVNH